MTVTVTKEYAGRTARIKVGDELVVELNGNPTSGYLWEVAHEDPAVLKQTNTLTFKDQSDQPGAANIQVLRFEATARGNTNLELVYRRNWEKDQPPLETYSIQVEVE